mgnify:CR=1 FL=1
MNSLTEAALKIVRPEDVRHTLTFKNICAWGNFGNDFGQQSQNFSCLDECTIRLSTSRRIDWYHPQAILRLGMTLRHTFSDMPESCWTWMRWLRHGIWLWKTQCLTQIACSVNSEMEDKGMDEEGKSMDEVIQVNMEDDLGNRDWMTGMTMTEWQGWNIWVT